MDDSVVSETAAPSYTRSHSDSREGCDEEHHTSQDDLNTDSQRREFDLTANRTNTRSL